MKNLQNDPTKLIWEEIEAIGKSLQRLKESRLTERAIIVLIHDAIPSSGYGTHKIGKTDIKKVLDAAANLKNFYLKKQKEMEAIK